MPATTPETDSSTVMTGRRMHNSERVIDPAKFYRPHPTADDTLTGSSCSAFGIGSSIPGTSPGILGTPLGIVRLLRYHGTTRPEILCPLHDNPHARGNSLPLYLYYSKPT